jgi:Fic family protein
MLELRLLMATGVPMTAAHLLSNFYNETRMQYYDTLARSSRDGNNGVRHFVSYALQGFADALDAQIQAILAEQLDLIWTNHVYSFFRSRKTQTAIRQRELLLDLSLGSKTIKLDELKFKLNIKVSQMYKGKTDRTLVRDINELIKLALLKKAAGEISANKESMRSFLPATRSRAT